MLDTTATLRDNIANFDDFFHPLRAYFYWEKHCFDIPVCWALRSIFDALDGLDQIVEKFTGLTAPVAIAADALLH
jgi:putative drug exporter of the RND superfamily